MYARAACLSDNNVTTVILLSPPIDTILTAYPLHCFRWKHFCIGVHSKFCERIAVVGKPTVESRVTHSRSLCQFVFVCAFHSRLI